MKNLIALFASTVLVASSFATLAEAQERRPSAGQPRSRTNVASRPQAPPARGRVAPAQHTEIIHEGPIEGEIISDGYYEPGYDVGVSSSCDSCGGGGCDSCSVSGDFCQGCNAPHRFCLCFPSHGWVHAEYLAWHNEGMRIPALLTTSLPGTARENAGVLGAPGTSVLFGNGTYMDDAQSGFRIRFGFWLANFPGLGVEGEYTGLGDQTETFFADSTGDPILGRPFFNARDGQQDAELVAFPDVVTGTALVTVNSQFEGAAFRFRRQVCCSSGCCFSQIHCKSVPYSTRWEATLGYRHWALSESILIYEELQMQGNQPGEIRVADQFDTRNLFNGAEIGMLWAGRRGCWSLDTLIRIGIGNVNQTVTIGGATRIRENGATTQYDNGFLALSSNSGTYSQNKAVLIPEIGVTLGYQLTKRLRATIGYSAVYWGNVVRPGDQIDLDVNPNLLPPEVTPFTGPERPQFAFHETDYLVQGLSLGAEFRW